MSTKDLNNFQRRQAVLAQASGRAAEMTHTPSEFEERRASQLADEATARQERSARRHKRAFVALAGLTLAVSPVGQKAGEVVGNAVGNALAVEQYQPTAEQGAVMARAQAAEEAREHPAPDSYLPPRDQWVTLTAEKPLVPWGIAEDAIPETDEKNDGNQRAELANDLIKQSKQDGTPAIEQGEQFAVPAEVVDQIDPKTIVER